jgi:hypothetical protein
MYLSCVLLIAAGSLLLGLVPDLSEMRFVSLCTTTSSGRIHCCRCGFDCLPRHNQDAEVTDRIRGPILHYPSRHRGEPRCVAERFRCLPVRSHKEMVAIEQWFRNRWKARLRS